MAELKVIDAEPAADPSIMERIAEVTKLAEEGALSSIAVATVYKDGSAGVSWSKPPNRSLLLGAISRLGHKLNLELDE
jgi:hypothetical protein